MAVKSLRAKNFLTYPDTGWIELHRINLIYGHNSSGKSVVKQFLEIFKNAIHNPNENEFFILDKVPFTKNNNDDVVFIFRLSTDGPMAGLLKPLKLSAEDIDTDIDIDLSLFFVRDINNLDKIVLSKLCVQISEIEKAGDIDLKYIFRAERTGNHSEWTLSSDFFNISDDDEIWRRVILNSGFLPSINGIDISIWDLVKKEIDVDGQQNELIDSKDEVNYLHKFLEIIRNDILFLLESTHFILPKTLIGFSQAPKLDNIEPAINDDEIPKLFFGADIRDDLLLDDYLSTGVTHVVSLIYDVLSLQRDNLATIEHPEAFLDAKIQLALTDFFIYWVIKKDVTLVIETNSELMLLRLLKRIRQTTRKKLPKIFQNLKVAVTRDDVSIWVTMKDNKKLSQLSNIQINDWGEVMTPWPGGFFEDGFNERFS